MKKTENQPIDRRYRDIIDLFRSHLILIEIKELRDCSDNFERLLFIVSSLSSIINSFLIEKQRYIKVDLRI